MPPEGHDAIAQPGHGAGRIDEEFGQFGASFQELFKALFHGFKFELKLARPCTQKTDVVLFGIDGPTKGATFQILGSEATAAFKLTKASRGERVVHGATISWIGYYWADPYTITVLSTP